MNFTLTLTRAEVTTLRLVLQNDIADNRVALRRTDYPAGSAQRIALQSCIDDSEALLARLDAAAGTRIPAPHAGERIGGV